MSNELLAMQLLGGSRGKTTRKPQTPFFWVKAPLGCAHLGVKLDGPNPSRRPDITAGDRNHMGPAPVKFLRSKTVVRPAPVTATQKMQTQRLVLWKIILALLSPRIVQFISRRLQ